MTIENLRQRLYIATEGGRDTLVEAVRDALRRGYTDEDIGNIIGFLNLKIIVNSIETESCNGMCITAAEVGVPEFPGIAYPHPDCPEHS